MSLEDEFLNDEECFVCLSLGIKGSGKTTLLLSYIKYCMVNNVYSDYHLVLPQYNNAQDNGKSQYGFLKNMKNTFIYTKYDSVISKNINTITSKTSNTKKTFYCVDDATASGIDIKKDIPLLELITMARHQKVSVWILMHAARSVLSVTIRANVDYMFVYRLSNLKIVQALFEEYFSLSGFDNVKSFVRYIMDIFETKFNSLFLSCRTSHFDNNVIGWNIYKYQDIDIDNKVKKNNTKKPLLDSITKKPDIQKKSSKSIFDNMF